MSSSSDLTPNAAEASEGSLLMERRRILSGLGMAGLGCLAAGSASTASAEEVIVRLGGGKDDKLHLPEEWMKRNR